MKRSILVSIFFLSLLSNFYAQDDYVIDNKKKIKEKNFNKSNTDYTSYFSTPTAFTLTKRDFRIASNNILFAKGSYGLTNKTTASVTVSAFGSLVASIKQNLKQNETVAISISSTFGDLSLAVRDTSFLFTGINGQATIGDKQNNLTIGTGIYYLNSNVEFINEEHEFLFHYINAGIQSQLSNNMYLMVDGMYFTNYNVFMGTAGLKFLLKTKYSFNVGLMPIIWDNIRTTRHDFTSGVLPFFSARMLIERKD